MWSKTRMSSARSRIQLLGATLAVVVLMWPGKPSLRLGAWAVVSTALIELSQLYQGDWALRLRAMRVGGLLLGHQFLWSDLLCVALGGTLAALLDATLSA